MTFHRAVASLALFLYLTISAAAFLFTMTRIRLPFIPNFLLVWSYGMMAPYQGDTDFNDDLLVEGLRPDGSAQKVDLGRYLPVGRGESNVRVRLRSFSSGEGEADREKFMEFALKLLDRERARGEEFSALRLTWQEWPRSPGGLEFLRHPLFIEETFITEVR